MGEWSTYRLSDFLLFSPRTYYRLFELYNAAVWPAYFAAAVLGFILLAVAGRSVPRSNGRTAAALLALVWIFIAYAYYWQRYATINWAADLYAFAWIAEAALLLTFAARGGIFLAESDPRRVNLGVAMVTFALVVQPVIGPLLAPVPERNWRALEIFAVAPDPTVVATLGFLVAARPLARWVLLPIPVVAAFVAGATLWTMEQPDAFVMPLLAVLAVGAGLCRHPRPSSPSPMGRGSG